MSNLKFHKVNALPVTADPDSVYALRSSAGSAFALFVSDTAGNLLPHQLNPAPFVQTGITVHLNAVANTSTNAVSTDLTPLFDGSYLLHLSFNWNGDTAAGDTVVYATFNGAAIDLNDRDTDPQGQFQILRQEPKDVAAGTGGNITGTGTGQKMSFYMPFNLGALTGGTNYPLVIDVGSETASSESAIWNIVARLEWYEP